MLGLKFLRRLRVQLAQHNMLLPEHFWHLVEREQATLLQGAVWAWAARRGYELLHGTVERINSQAVCLNCGVEERMGTGCVDFYAKLVAQARHSLLFHGRLQVQGLERRPRNSGGAHLVAAFGRLPSPLSGTPQLAAATGAAAAVEAQEQPHGSAGAKRGAEGREAPRPGGSSTQCPWPFGMWSW